MTGIRVWKVLAVTAGIGLAVDGFHGRVSAGEERTVGVADCYFAQDPDQFLNRQGRVRAELFERSTKINRALRSTNAPAAVPAASLPVRNFIDQGIFDRLATLDLPAAPVSSDAEFLRRITLDLTGRIPTPSDVKAFLADTSETKRDALIDRLLYSAEFTDRWTLWMGDWLQNTATLSAAAIQRQVNGRNAFHVWIQDAVYSEKSLKDVAYEVVVATGNNFDGKTGNASFPIGADTAMGPVQDRYDTMLAKTASMFLGLSYYDCILCHNGRGHLDQLSLWGSRAPRTEALQMSAFFSRMRLALHPDRQLRDQPAPFYLNSYFVSDAGTGTYDLNTTNGNRPPRQPIGNVRNLTPAYRLGGTPPDANWRSAFAENMIRDPMFARNIANRLWKTVFNLGLVEPVDGMDPARLDPANPPPAPWMLQATHPELLEKLAAELVNMNYQLRPFLRMLVQSTAYQLSSRYDGDWNVQFVPLFARHYARRLEGEEIHDAISQATGVLASYALTGFGDPVRWAIQMPEPSEPRGAGPILTAFVRGNRDTQQRTQAGSIQQQLALMNDPFVANRVRVTASATLRAIGLSTKQEDVLNEVFLLFLGRYPTEYERGKGLAFLQRKWSTAALRNEAVEDLAWVCINKSEFLFSY